MDDQQHDEPTADDHDAWFRQTLEGIRLQARADADRVFAEMAAREREQEIEFAKNFLYSRPPIDPWTDEPIGPQYAYMIRFAPHHGKGMGGFEWPRHGYVECKSYVLWCKPNLDHGLAGFLHGQGNYDVAWREFFGGALQPPLAYAVIVDPADVKAWNGGWEDSDSCRAWRGWVKHVGSFAEVCWMLRAEGDYGSKVAEASERGLAAAEAVAVKSPLYDRAHIWGLNTFIRSSALNNMSRPEKERFYGPFHTGLDFLRIIDALAPRAPK